MSQLVQFNASSVSGWPWNELVFSRLKKLSGGQLTVCNGSQTSVFGEFGAELSATIRVHDARFFRRIATGGGLGAAESLMDGQWSCDDLTALIRIFIRNWEIASTLERGLATTKQFIARLGHALRTNHRANARRNIHEHYDLGNDLFSLFLDETLSYSCGLFASPNDSMHSASMAKLERVCQMLELSPKDHLIEIGTGWGGLALHAAQRYGCRVTTTTISREQYDVACRRVKQAGLEQRVTVLLEDYRDLRGQYDKLVSIEMIEAVGSAYFPAFFQQCSRLLRDNGAMFLQSIVIRDQHFEAHRTSVDFIRKHIFPGGCLPSVAALLQAMTRVSDFQLTRHDDVGAHYVLTLQRWRQQFWEHIDQVRALGYSERFIRMWDYYFCYCEAAFAEKEVSDVQMLFTKRGSNLGRLNIERLPQTLHSREDRNAVENLTESRA